MMRVLSILFWVHFACRRMGRRRRSAAEAGLFRHTWGLPRLHPVRCRTSGIRASAWGSERNTSSTPA